MQVDLDVEGTPPRIARRVLVTEDCPETGTDLRRHARVDAVLLERKDEVAVRHVHAVLEGFVIVGERWTPRDAGGERRERHKRGRVDVEADTNGAVADANHVRCREQNAVKQWHRRNLA